jgi:hypothetical protein
MRSIRLVGLVLAPCAALLALFSVIAIAAEPQVPAPANDTFAGAQVIHTLPATLGGTLVGATVEPLEAPAECGSGSEHTVWYSLRTPSVERVAINLAAAGALDANIEVFHAVRSQLNRIDCETTDSHGKASLSFKSSKNGLYDIRVAAQQASQLAGFTLEVFLPTPAVAPPGPRLPAGGVSGKVDRIQNVNAAYSMIMHSGVSYLINLTNKTAGGCVSGGLFAPGTSSFEEGSPLLHIGCGGYRLFTPGPGQGGVYSIQITPRTSFRAVQRFHLEVAPAGPDETAPGIGLVNYAHEHGHLNGNGIRVLRLYRLDIATHSNLSLKLLAPDSANFNLQLRNLNGQVIECECGSSGNQTLVHQLAPGRYYAVVSARGATAGNYTLIRESRTITRTSVSFSSAKARPGQPLGIDVKVSPTVSGPVTVDIERFDPVFGWQFYSRRAAFASGGSASVAFTPPAVGRWRANASYGGSRTASPSAVGFSYLLVS